jgi:hypothetical protein
MPETDAFTGSDGKTGYLRKVCNIYTNFHIQIIVKNGVNASVSGITKLGVH